MVTASSHDTPAEHENPDQADESLLLWATWLYDRVDRAARLWDLTLAARPRVGGRGMQNMYGPVRGPGGDRWLRLAAQFEGEPEDRFLWTGNEAANAVVGVPKPRVLDVAEWQDRYDGTDWPCAVRAELMTKLAGRPVQDPETLAWVGVPAAGWWDELDAALAVIRAAPVPGERCLPDDPARLVRDTLGVEIAVSRWESAHGDLHWCNVFVEPFGIVDWESWGLYPAGTGEAHLYLTALPVPELAQLTWERFAPVLDTEDGRVALLVDGARMLGWFPIWEEPEPAGIWAFMQTLGAR